MQQEIRQLSEPVAMELEENYIMEVERKKNTELLGKNIHLQMKPNSLVPAFPDRNCPCRHEPGRRRVLHDLSCWGSEGGKEGGTEGPRMPGRGTIGQGGKKSN